MDQPTAGGLRQAAPPPPRKRPTARNRVAPSLVALSSAAILAVYALGYARTESAAEKLAVEDRSVGSHPTTALPVTSPSTQPATSAPSALASPESDAPSRNGRLPSDLQTAPPSPTFSPTTTPTAVANRLRDGTYTATGRSRHGDIEAAVVIRGGKIVSAPITGCFTRYPCSKISALPSQVVARQSADVDLISGATDSSLAYQDAISQALAQAQVS